jgi:acyl-CoA reductase-like NAD-dependent aldehyde dehydrogenase
MATQSQVNDVVRAFRDASAGPRTAAEMLYQIAQNMYEDAGELASAWQDKNAGACWARAARLIDRAAAELDRGAA